MTRRTVQLSLEGLVAVHGARAVHTALGGVHGIVSATVTMAGALVDVEGPFEPEQFGAALREALGPFGVVVTGISVVQERVLPLA